MGIGKYRGLVLRVGSLRCWAVARHWLLKYLVESVNSSDSPRRSTIGWMTGHGPAEQKRRKRQAAADPKSVMGIGKSYETSSTRPMGKSIEHQAGDGDQKPLLIVILKLITIHACQLSQSGRLM